MFDAFRKKFFGRRPEPEEEGQPNETSTPRARLESEALEPRILLSATWVDADTGDAQPGATEDADRFTGDAGDDVAHGLGGDDELIGGAGDDQLFGDAGDDLLRGGAGDDVLSGGAGTDRVDYSDATSGVTVDLTATGPQDTGGAGTDTLSDVEAVTGSAHSDTFAFSAPVDGATYSIDGGSGGTNTIDLSGYDLDAITFAEGSLSVDMGGGQSFTVEYTNIDSFGFADTSATVLDADSSTQTGFSGSGVFVDGSEVFSVELTGPGRLDFSYDDHTGALTISDTDATDATSSLSITDLSGTDLDVSAITVDTDLASLTSNVDLGTLNIDASHNVATITVGGGSGTIGHLNYTGLDLDSGPVTVNADVTTLSLADDLESDLTINGDVGTATIADDLDNALVVNGDLGSLTVNDLAAGSVDVSGNLTSISYGGASVDGTLSVGGDLGSYSAGLVLGTIDVTGDVSTMTLSSDLRGALTIGGNLGTITTTDDFESDITVGGNVGTMSAGDDFKGGATLTVGGDLGSITAGELFDHTVVVGGDFDSLTVGSTFSGSVTASGVSGGLAIDAAGFTAAETLNVAHSMTFDGSSLGLTSNVAFTAEAGANQAVSDGDVVTLDASGTVDPDSRGLIYEWVQTGGPTVTLSDPNAPAPTFTVPEGVDATDITFQLTVTNLGDYDRTLEGHSPVSLWSFDETSGTTASDETGGHDATFVHSPTLGSDGFAPGQSAATFDGVNDYVEVPHHADYLLDSGTVEMWFNSDDVSHRQGLFSKDSSGYDHGGHLSMFVDNGQIEVRLQSDSASYEIAGGTLTDGGWHHVAFSFGDDGMQLYVDGVLVDSNAYTGGLDASSGGTGNTEPIVIGANQWGSGDGVANHLEDPFHGRIAEVAIFSDGISASEANDLYQAGSTEGSETATDTVTISVTADDDAPVAAAGADQDVTAGTTVTLDGSTSLDPEGNTLTYTWVQTGGPAVTLSDPNAAQPTFDAPAGVSNTEITFELTVSDGSLTATDSVAVTVGSDATVASADAGAPQTVTEGDVVTLDASGTVNPDNDTLTYTWVQTGGPAVTLSDPNSPNPTFTAPEGVDTSEITFELTVVDPATDYATVVAANGPISHWTFDESSGTSATDTVLGNSGTYTGHPTLDQAGPRTGDSSVRFDGHDDFVEMPHHADYELDSGMVQMWFNSDDVSSRQGLFSKDSSGYDQGGHLTMWVDNGEIEVRLQSDTASHWVNGGTLSDGEWHHVAFSFGDDGMKLYVDGELVDTDTYTGGLDASSGGTGNTEPIVVGANQWTSGDGVANNLIEHFQGSIDDVAIFGSAPTDSSVEAMYQAGSHADVERTSVDTVTITVEADNDAPTASAGPDQVVTEGATVTLAGSGTDLEGESLTYTWVQTGGPTVTLSDPGAENPTFEAPNLAANADITFQLTVSDGTNNTVDDVTVTVEATDEGPVSSHDGIWFDTTQGSDEFGSFGDLHDSYLEFLGTQEETISFTGLAEGTKLSDQFPGVTFENTATGPLASHSGVRPEGGAYVENMTGYDGTAMPDGDNVYLKFDNDDPSAPFTINFDDPVASVGAHIGMGVQGTDHSVTVSLFDANGDLISSTQIDARLWETSSTQQNYESVFAVQLDEAVISRVEILNSSNVNYANALLIDEIGYSHTPAVSEDFRTTEEVPFVTPNVLDNDFDPEGGVVTVDSFTQAGNGSVTYNGDGTFTYTPDANFSGTDTFTYTTVDDAGNTDTATVTVEVAGVQDAPLAEAGADQIVGEGQTVTLDASASSDVDGDTLTYTWVQTGGPTVTLDDPSAASPSFTAPEGIGDAELSFELTVSDGTDTHVDSVNVSVQTDNDVFRFDGAVDGSAYLVDGEGGIDTLDLSTFSRDALEFEYGRLTVQLDGGGSFTVDYQNIETIDLADGPVNLYVWDADSGTSDPSDPANWSRDTLPGASDIVVFDGTSDLGATLGSDMGAIGGILVGPEYDGTIRLDGALSVTGDIDLQSGKIDTDGHPIAVDGDLRVSGGSFVADSGTTSVGGDLVVETGSSFTTTGPVVLDGSGDQTLSLSGQTLYDLLIEKSAGAVTLDGEMHLKGDYTANGTTVHGGTSEVHFEGGNITLDVATTTFDDVVFDHGYTITLTGDMDVDGDLTVESLYYLNGGEVHVAGDLTTTDTSVRGTATFVLDGTGDQTLSANGGTGELSHVEIDKASGTLTLADTIQVSGDFTHTAGTVDAGTSTVEFQGGDLTITPGDMQFNDVVFDHGYTITLDGNLDVDGDLTIESLYYLNGGEVHVAGDVTTTDTSVRGTATFVLDGTGDQTLSANGGTGELSHLEIDKASGTLTLADTIQISGDFTHTAGTVDAGTSAVEFQGGDLTITPGDVQFNDVVFDHGYTITLDGNLDVDGDLTVESLYYLNGGEVHVAGDLTTTDTSVRGTATFVLDGTGDQTLSANGGTGELSHLEIDKASGTLTLADTIQISGDFTHTAGTVDAGTSTVEFQGGNLTITPGDVQFNDVVFDHGYTITLDGNLDVDGDLTIESLYYLNGGEVHVAGDLTTTDTSVRGTATFVLDGTGAQTLSANGGTGELSHVEIDKASGTLTLADTIQVSGDFTHTAGTVDAGTSTVEFQGGNLTITPGDVQFNDVVFDHGYTITLDGNLDVDGDLTVESLYYLNGGEVHVAGDLTTTDTSVRGTATFVLDGTGDQTLSANGGTGELSHVEIDKASGTLTLADTIQISGDFTHTAGTVDAGTSTVEFQGGNLTITPGDVQFNDVVFDHGYTITLDGNLDVDGDLTIESLYYLNGGEVHVAGDLTTTDTSVRGTATFVLDGTGDQTLSANGGTGELSHVEIDKASGTLTLADTIQVSGDFTHTAGTVDAGTSTVEFQGGNLTITPGDVQFNDVVFDHGYTITLDGNLDVDGDLTIESLYYLNGGEVHVAGDLTTTDTSVRGTATFLLDGTGDQTLSANGGTGELSHVEIDKASGTLTLADTIQISGNFTHTSGTVDAGTSTVEFQGGDLTITPGDMHFNDIVFDHGYTITLDGDMQVDGDLTIEKLYYLNGGDVRVAGDLTALDSNYRGDAGLVLVGDSATVAMAGDDDTLRFDDVTPGAVYEVAGAGGTDTLDLRPYSVHDVSDDGATLIVDMGDGDSFTINYTSIEEILLAQDTAPTVSAGADFSVEEGSLVTLTGSGHDPENQAISYTWTQTGGPAVILDDPHAASPTFEAPEGLSNTDLTFELSVSDGTYTSTDGVTVTVNADNDAPTADAGTPQSVDEGDIVTLAGSGIDPENGTLTLTWVQTGGPTVVLDDPHAASPTFEAPEGLVNTDLTFELQVSDGTNTSSDTVSVTVHADDDAPSAEAGSSQTVDEGDTVTLAGSGTDPEGQGLSYTWVQTGGPSVVLDDPHAASPTFEAPEGLVNTDLTFELHVSDGTNEAADTVTITVHADDDAPVSEAGPPQAVEEGDTVTLAGSGSGPENQPLSYTWVQTGGPTVVLDDPHAATPSFDAPEGLANTDLTFELHVSDGTSEAADTVTITVHADNDAPSAEAGSLQSVSGGQRVELSGSGTDPEARGLSYTWIQVSGPPVQLDDPHAENPTFEMPAEGGEVVFQLQVSDGENTSADTVSVVGSPNPEATPELGETPEPESEARSAPESEQRPDVDSVQGLASASTSGADAPASERPNLASLFKEVEADREPAERASTLGLPEDLTETDFNELFEADTEVMADGATKPLSPDAEEAQLSDVAQRTVGAGTEADRESGTDQQRRAGGFFAGLLSLMRGVAGTSKLPGEGGERDAGSTGTRSKKN